MNSSRINKVLIHFYHLQSCVILDKLQTILCIKGDYINAHEIS